jgi:hypothetical protein
MTQALKQTNVVRVVRPRRIHPTTFDNWYVHCPKCGGLLVLRMGSGGPAWVCLCPASGTQRGDHRETIGESG